MLRVRRGKKALIAAAIGATLPATFSMAQTASWTYQGTAFPWTGTWNVATNWSPSSAFPNSATAVANFGFAQVAGATGTVVINNAPVTVNKLTFQLSGTNAFSYLITGTGTLASLNVANGGTIDIGGIGTTTIATATISTAVVTPANSTIYKQGNGNLVLTGANSFGGGSTLNVNGLSINAGTLTAVGASALNGLGIISTSGSGVLELQGVTLGSAGTAGFKVVGGIGSTGSFAGGMVHAVGNNTWYGPWYSIAGSAGVDAGGTLTVDGDLLDGEAPALNGFSKVGGDGLMQVNSMTLNGPLSISAGTLKVNAGTSSNSAAGASTTSSLSITGTGKLDLTNNSLTIAYGANPSPAADIRAYLAAGRNGGAWNGATGILSSSAAADSTHLALGYKDIPGTEVDIKFTRNGDATLDGTVNFNDLLLISQHYNQSGWDWAGGDFTYDGTVNFNDLLIVSQNYNGTVPAVALTSLGADFAADWKLATSQVPEPTALAVLGVGCVGLVGGRRRRGKI